MKISFVSTKGSEEAFFEGQLSDHEFEFVSSIDKVSREAEIVSLFIYDWLDLAFLESHPALRLVCTRSTGFDHIEVEHCRHRRIVVSTVPAYGENTVAEHAFALILSLSRRLRVDRRIKTS